jgi:hypothetical protein
MNRCIHSWMWLLVAMLVLLCPPLMAAEDDESANQSTKAIESVVKPANAKSPDIQPAKKTSNAPVAPGVMITIDPDTDVGDTVSRHDVVELLAVDKDFSWAKDVDFRHEIWGLQFKFKPVRMISVDVPQSSGKMQRKLIWYMVYSVTNTGKTMMPVKDAPLSYEKELANKEKIYEIKSVDKPIHFSPAFLLDGHNRLKEGEGFTKLYPDRVIPVADAAIQVREGYGQKILTSVEMNRDIPVGRTVWGVATWEDLDPKIVQFSVYVTGLTNAYRWEDTPEGYKEGDPVAKGRKLLRKTLKLNFWRPGDSYYETEDEIRYGIPGRVDYEWVYR